MFPLLLKAAFVACVALCVVRGKDAAFISSMDLTLNAAPVDNSSLGNGTGNATGDGGTDALAIATDFLHRIEICAEVEDDPSISDKNLRVLHSLCKNPQVFAECMNPPGNLGNQNVRGLDKATEMFCGEFHLDVEKSGGAGECLKNFPDKLGTCLDGKDAAMKMLSDIVADRSAVKEDSVCSQYADAMKCLREEAKTCDAKTEAVAEYYQAWVGGDCLEKSEILNRFWTFEMKDSASVSVPGILVVLTSTSLTLVIGSFY